MALWGVCLNEIALVLLCVAMLLVQKTRVTLSTIGYKTKVEVITTWSPASTRANGNLVGFVFLALQNNSFLLIGHFLFAKALSVSGFGAYFNLLLFRHLETEYIRHCIPSNVSSGLSSLPLPYMYVDEIAKSDQSTTQELPSRDRLSGAQTYLKLISVFTTLVVSPEKLKHISQEKLDELSSHVSVTWIILNPRNQKREGTVMTYER